MFLAGATVNISKQLMRLNEREFTEVTESAVKTVRTLSVFVATDTEMSMVGDCLLDGCFEQQTASSEDVNSLTGFE